jgi:hypothetical protein
MSEIAPDVPYSDMKVRVRAEQQPDGGFAVIERTTGRIVLDGFETYSACWAWIANHSLKTNHD